jgi:hypothetical protein
MAATTSTSTTTAAGAEASSPNKSQQKELWEIIHNGKTFLQSLEEYAVANFPPSTSAQDENDGNSHQADGSTALVITNSGHPQGGGDDTVAQRPEQTTKKNVSGSGASPNGNENENENDKEPAAAIEQRTSAHPKNPQERQQAPSTSPVTEISTTTTTPRLKNSCRKR